MSAKWLMVIGVLLLAGNGSADSAAGMQKVFKRFPFLNLKTNADGTPAFQTLTLDEPVKTMGHEYYGFRFKVPQRTNHEDLCWAFISGHHIWWYIVPETGQMEGFENFTYHSRGDYAGVNELSPEPDQLLYTQHLDGENLEDGKKYLIWFRYSKGYTPGKISVAFTFAEPHMQASNDVAALNRVLGLKYQEYPHVTNAANHHIYYLLRADTWEDSEAQAVAAGGHLATVRSEAEEAWICNTFSAYDGYSRWLWIGLHAPKNKSDYEWSSGEPVTYTNWMPHRPSRPVKKGANFVAIRAPSLANYGKWAEWGQRSRDTHNLPMNGVVEIIPKAGEAAEKNESGNIPLK